MPLPTKQYTKEWWMRKHNVNTKKIKPFIIIIAFALTVQNSEKHTLYPNSDIYFRLDKKIDSLCALISMKKASELGSCTMMVSKNDTSYSTQTIFQVDEYIEKDYKLYFDNEMKIKSFFPIGHEPTTNDEFISECSDSVREALQKKVKIFNEFFGLQLYGNALINTNSEQYLPKLDDSFVDSPAFEGRSLISVVYCT
jgi:hypothetical protein